MVKRGGSGLKFISAVSGVWVTYKPNSSPLIRFIFFREACLFCSKISMSLSSIGVEAYSHSSIIFTTALLFSPAFSLSPCFLIKSFKNSAESSKNSSCSLTSRAFAIYGISSALISLVPFR